MTAPAVPDIDDVRRAARRIAGHVHRTPVLTSRSIDALVGRPVHLKAEHLQRGGAFKLRGATNAVLALDDAAARRGVAAHSSGNHAAALALAAAARGIPCHVVMPADAPAAKLAATRGYGATVVLCEPTLEARAATLAEVVARTGAVEIHPYDHPDVIAGQGTATLELLEDVPGIRTVVAPVSGGGLLSGTAIAAHGTDPGIAVVGGEPEQVDDAHRSVAAGRLVTGHNTTSMADGLLAVLSERTLAVLLEHDVAVVTVSEDEIVDAMALVFERMKQVVEPSAAVAVAALLALGRSGAVPDGDVGVILSGGNVDLDRLPFAGRGGAPFGGGVGEVSADERGARLDRLPLTYGECRARFRRAVGAAATAEAHPIAARGPHGEELTLDVARYGSADPRRALLVLSGVHGVEGFIGSTLQCDLATRLGDAALPPDVAVVLVHAVNPWGMAWWRRQNESNVDLNRNWRRSDTEPWHNDGYDELHPLACPDTTDLPDIGDLLVAAADLVAARGLPWVRDAITVGQYRHPDGLHYGGAETEESNRVLEWIVAAHLGGVERLLTVDLHTGHGPRAEVTVLSDAPPGSDQDRFFRATFVDARVEATTDNPDATTGRKSGQIGNGLADVLPGATCFATSLEIGTSPDEEQLVATYHEQWVHRRGDRTDPRHAAAVWAYRCCFTPDDPAWECQARAVGNRQLDAALAAVAGWA